MDSIAPHRGWVALILSLNWAIVAGVCAEPVATDAGARLSFGHPPGEYQTVPSVPHASAAPAGGPAVHDAASRHALRPRTGDSGTGAGFAHARLLAWRPSFSGDLTLPGGSAFDLEAVNIDEPVFAPFAELRLGTGAWSVRAGGFVVSTDSRATADTTIDAGAIVFAPGDRVRTDIDYAVIEGAATYTFAPLYTSPGFDRQPDTGAAVWFDAFAGMRYWDLEVGLTNAMGGEASSGGDWFAPLIGGSLHIDLPEGFAVGVQTDFAWLDTGDSSAFAWSIEASFVYEITEHFDAELGFRHMSIDLENDGFDFDGWSAGLFFGANVGF